VGSWSSFSDDRVYQIDVLLLYPNVGNPGIGQKKGTHRGQIRIESPGNAGTDPGGSPPRTTALTFTDP
jgi:hypothetical protein